MKKELLDRYIGELVNITLVDGQIIMGQLRFCSECRDKRGWGRPGYHFIGDVHFTADNVKTLELI